MDTQPVRATVPHRQHRHCDECGTRHPVASTYRPAGWVTLYLHDGTLKARLTRLFCSKACLVNFTYNTLRGCQDYPSGPVEAEARTS